MKVVPAPRTGPALTCPFCKGTMPHCCWLGAFEHDSLEHQYRALKKQQAEALEQEREAQRYSVDFVARFADAWDLKGQHVLRASRVEHRVLLELAGLPSQLCSSTWEQLEGKQRESLLWAAKAAIALGKQCAWIFGA